MLGFTYNGIYSGDYGVWCVPDAAGRWIQDPDYDVYDEDVSWHNGGYLYGKAVKKRQMEIKCFYEEIDDETREKIRKWLHRSTKGKLMFDDMPFVYWNVTPTKPVLGEKYLDTDESYSGTFSVTFTAYDPFGYLTRKANTGTENDGAEKYCGMILQSQMPSPPTTGGTMFDVYNPGTEVCGLTLKISGTTSNPIMFLNNANKTSCILYSLPSNGLILDVNGDHGKVTVYNASSPNNTDYGFAYHDRGYIRLEPSELYSGIRYTNDGINGTLRVIGLNGISVSKDMKGTLITFNNQSGLTAHVEDVNVSTNQVYCSMAGTGTLPGNGICNVYMLNHIQIFEKNNSGTWGTVSTLSLSTISVDYNPRIL